MKSHFTFSPSAAGDLRKAIQTTGSGDKVHALFDDLSFGPINPPSPELRCGWVEQELGITDWKDVTDRSEEFYNAAPSAAGNVVIWVSRRSSREFAGYLELLRRLSGAPCEVVDLTEVITVGIGRHGAKNPPQITKSSGQLSSEVMLRERLFDRGVLLSSDVRQDYVELWNRLSEENASLRVVDASGFHSAAMEHFDELLVSCATEKWQKMAHTVGGALQRSYENSYCPAGDLVLVARAFALIDSGRLEGRGQMTNARDTEIRRPW